jgi:tetratricopeptide (TPR) repeat protein/transcriptional regulator with XRE-family HTH domain
VSDSDPYAFGEILRTLRLQRHRSQNYLATKLGVHRNSISKWERGICLPESKTMVLELAHQLQLDSHDTQRLLEASLTTFSPYWHIPFPRNPFFTGRDSLLRDLHEELGRKGTTVPNQTIILSGLGGVGKTQVAIEYAYRYVYDYAAILWVAAETQESLMASFTTLADVLYLPERHTREQQPLIKAVHRWLDKHGDWLLIFDNVEDLGLVKPFLPAARSGAVLLTTRLQNGGGLAKSIGLKPMTSEEGLQFLLSRTGLLNSNDLSNTLPLKETQAAQSIIEFMDGLPLALDQAGAYIEATRCSLQNYLHLLQTTQLRLLDERDAYADHPLSVSKTFTLAFERLSQKSALAADLLTVCAFLGSDAIPETFFSEGAVYLGPTFEALAADPLQFNAAIKMLQAYSFVQRNTSTQTLTIHRLLQVVIKERMSEADQRMWAIRVLCAMNQLFPWDEKAQDDYWQIGKHLLPHALVCIALGEQWCRDEVPYITLMCHVATYLLESACYIEAESLYNRALDAGQALGSDFCVAEVLCGLARLYWIQDKHGMAELLYRQVLLMLEQVQEAGRPLMVKALCELASLYSRKGKYAEAEALGQRALRMQEQALGMEHPQVASVLYNLAGLCYEQGKYVEAESLYQRALRIRQYALGMEHPQVASVLNNLAEVYRGQGKYVEAEPLYQQALRIWEQGLGPEHPRVAYPLNNLAEVYREQGKYVEAEPLYQRALRIWEQGLGPEHSLITDPLYGLAEIYRVQNKYAEAELFYQRVLRIRRQTLGPEHPEVAETLHYLAAFYQMQLQPLDALSLYQQALAIRERTLGSHHPKTDITRRAYAHLLREMGRVEEAMSLEDRSCIAKK